VTETPNDRPAIGRRTFLAGAAASSFMAAAAACSFGGSSGGGSGASSDSGPIRLQSFQPADVVKIWGPQFADFQKSGGVQVKHEFTAKASQNQTLLTQATSGTLPDIALISADSFPSLASRGLLAPLDSYQFKNFQVSDEPSVLQNLYKHQDKVYGIGTDLDLGLLFYNIDLFKAAGIAVPTPDTTYDELRTMAKKLTKGSGSGKYYGLDTQGFTGAYLLMSALAWSNGGQLMDADKKQVTVTDGPGRQAVDWMSGMIGTDKSVPPPNSEGTSLTNGRVGMGMYGAWGAYYILNGVKFKWGVTQLPKGTSGQQTYGSGSCLVIFNSSKKKASAAKFIDFFLKDTLQIQRAHDWAWTPPTKTVLSSSDFGQSGALTLTADQKGVVNAAADSARALVITPDQTKVYSVLSDALTDVASGHTDSAGVAKQLTDGWTPLLSS
jgi:multiple sugar transport system substrate-binding protein